MKKKTRQRLLWLLWLLVAAALATLLLIQPREHLPTMRWRAPVHMALPPVPEALERLEKLVPEIERPETSASPIYPYEEKAPPAPPPALEPAAPHREEAPKGRARIAVILDDMGVVPAASARAVRLPARITLSYLPYAPNLQEQVDLAREAGHEIMLHLPMEPLGRENPGPGALLAAQTPKELRERLEKALDSFSGYGGVNNHMGSKLTKDREKMALVLQVLHERGLFFVDSRTSGQTVAETTARVLNVRAAGRDVFLDDTIADDSIRQQLALAESVARRKGSAIVIGHPHAATLRALEAWLPAVGARGIEIVPVESLVR